MKVTMIGFQIYSIVSLSLFRSLDLSILFQDVLSHLFLNTIHHSNIDARLIWVICIHLGSILRKKLGCFDAFPIRSSIALTQDTYMEWCLTIFFRIRPIDTKSRLTLDGRDENIVQMKQYDFVHSLCSLSYCSCSCTYITP